MSNLIPFQFKESQIRVITDESCNPWFVARDVAAALGYARPNEAILAHCKKAKSLNSLGTVNQRTQLDQQLKLIQESDVYRLTMRSKLESAEAFQDWIVEEVIPSIRKTGSYQLTSSVDPTQLLNDPAAMRGLLLGYTEKVLELEAKVEEIQPKADALDLISGSEGSINITNSAKTLQVQPKQLFSWMQTHNWIYRRPGGKSYVAYQERIKSGLLEHKIASVPRGDGSNKVVEQVLITPKGLSILSLLKIAA